MTKWRWYAAREFPRVVRALGLPAATSQPGVTRCPLHDEPLGAVTHLCRSCFEEAWAEVGRRYVEQGRPKTNTNQKEEGE